jgi:hypothetical protein
MYFPPRTYLPARVPLRVRVPLSAGSDKALTNPSWFDNRVVSARRRTSRYALGAAARQSYLSKRPVLAIALSLPPANSVHMDDDRSRPDDRTRLDDDRARRRALLRRRHSAVTAFLHEILLTAEALERARISPATRPCTSSRARTRWLPSRPASSSCTSRRTTGGRGKSR